MTMIHADNDLEYWARDYWLGHCEGFHVEDGTRVLGVVEEILGDGEEPEFLVLRGGLFANRTYKIRVDAVLGIWPQARRILVRGDRQPAD